MIPVTLVLFAGLTAVWASRRWSAAARHWILTAAIACALAMPLLQRAAPRLPAPGWLGLSRSAQPLTMFVTLPDVTVDDRGVGAFGAQAPRRSTDRAIWLASVWIAGSAIAAALLLVGVARVRWLASHAREITHGAWREIADDLSRDVGLPRRVRILQSAHPHALLTWGWRRPVILLPACAADWPDERIRIVLAHEMAHVRRRDWLAQMAGEILRCAHWFNPVVWAACRTLRRESELACDNEVLNRGVEAPVYADHLLDVARALNRRGRSGGFLAPAMACSSTLERRIRAMLDSHSNRKPMSRTASIGALLLTAALALPVAGLFASAQGPTDASFSGSLLDATGRPMPDIPIVVVNSQSHARFEAQTDPSGHFAFASLPAGDYDIQVQQPGFKLWQSRVTIRAGESVQRDIALQIGEVHETITIRALSDGAAPPPPPPPPPAPPRPPAFADPCGPNPVGGCIEAPKKVTDVRPIYPEAQRLAGVAATVKIEAVIGTDGRVKDLRAIDPADSEFAKAAMDAIARWQFTPTRVGGVPVETRMIVTTNFEIIR